MEKINDAREFFNIEEYPGNFFDYIVKDKNYIDNYGILLFKQDMGVTSGFIGYGCEGIPIICINYNRNIGHQNLTFAHEIGHMFLHKGVAMNDDSSDIDKLNKEDYTEHEAFEFAAEIVYPQKNVKEDYIYINENKLLLAKNSIKLANYINKLCEKYFISFTFAMNRLLFMNDYPYKVTSKTYQVKLKAGKLSTRYNNFTHIVVKGHPYYRPYIQPVFEMKEYVDKLTREEKISYETGQAIINRNADLEGYNEILK